MYKFLTAFSVLAFSVSSAFAADGTITINGQITDTTCSISVNGGTENETVTLPTVSSSTLVSAGQTAGATPFNISLTGCTGSALNTASTFFEPGAYVDGTTGRLNVDSAMAGAATNVQVQLLNSDMNAIVAGSDAASQNDTPVDITSGSGVLNYYAQYYATGQTTAGPVTTQVDYTIVYE